MKLIDHTRPGQMMRPWHRLCYVDYWRRRDTTALIGLHLVVRWCHRIWEWSFDYRPSAFEVKISDAFSEGASSRTEEVVRLLDERDAAYEDGRKVGRTEGYIQRSREYEDQDESIQRPWKDVVKP